MTSSAKTLRARTLKRLERAAMRWYASENPEAVATWLQPQYKNPYALLIKACAAHAAALKRKRTGRR